MVRRILGCSCHGLNPLFTLPPLTTSYAGWRVARRRPAALSAHYFQVNLSKLQPFYTLLSRGRQAAKTFSTGCILRLYHMATKRDRRKVEKAPLSLRFFRRFLLRRLRRGQTIGVCMGYRRRYAFFLATSLLPFMRLHSRSLVFVPQALTGAFSFRRIKAIKKRIRKRLGSPRQAR